MMAKTKIKYTTDDLLTISAFEKLTKAPVVDYINGGDVVYFLIDKVPVSAVIGKNGSKIKEVEKVMGKKVKVFRYSRDLKKFVKNLLLIDVKDIKILKNNDKIIVKAKVDKKYRPMIIGREGKNIKMIREFLRRWFNVEDIKLE